MPKAPRTAEVARRLVDAYVMDLRQHLPTYCIRQLDKLPKAHEAQLTRLRQSYPGTPTELLYFLQRLNGTCWETLTAPQRAVPSNAAVAAAKSNGTGATGASRTAASPVSGKPNAKASAAAASMASEAAAFIKSQIAKTVSGGAATAGGTHSGAATGAGAGATTLMRPRRLPHFVAVPILGSAYPNCPYYLKSVDQMLLAEQQFPPPSANLPDEGEGWNPPSPPTPSRASSAAPPSTAEKATPPPTPERPSTTTPTKEPVNAGMQDLAAAAAASTTAPCGAPLNKNSIASVYKGYKIIYGAPPALAKDVPATKTTTSSTTLNASKASPLSALTAAETKIDTSNANTIDTSRAAASPTAETADPTAVVYVDPRIDIHAKFYHWLVFADSVQPHVRGAPTVMPDADPAKVAAAAAAAATGSTTSNATLSPAAASNANEGKNASLSSSLSRTTTTLAAADAAGIADAAATTPVKTFAVSRLYLDFKPVEAQGGVYGQVIQFVHGQPDSFTVVADDFGSFLKCIMKDEYEFTEELEDDDDDDADEGDEETEKDSARVEPQAEKKRVPLPKPQ